MITFDDVRKEKELTYCLIPAIMHGPLVYKMRAAGIETKVYSQLRVRMGQVPEMKYLSEEDIQDATDFFEKAGYANLMCFGLIISHCNIDDLRNKSLLFFGETKDPDYKAEIEACEREAKKHRNQEGISFLNNTEVGE